MSSFRRRDRRWWKPIVVDDMHHVRTAVCPAGGAAGSGAECSSVSDHKIVSSNPRTEQEIHTWVITKSCLDSLVSDFGNERSSGPDLWCHYSKIKVKLINQSAPPSCQVSFAIRSAFLINQQLVIQGRSEHEPKTDWISGRRIALRVL